MRSPAHEPISIGAKVKAGSWARRGARSARVQVPLELRSCPALPVLCCKARGVGSDFFSTAHPRSGGGRGDQAGGLRGLVGRRVHGPRGVRIGRGHLVRARPWASQDDAAVAERLHATLLDPRTLERVARGLSPELGSGNAGLSGEAIERIRQSIDVRPSGDKKIAISFRAGSAAYAQHGCQELAQLAGQYLEAMTSVASPAAEEGAKRAKALEEKTRELAAFVQRTPRWP